MATNSAQGSGTGAAPATTQTATNSAGGPGAEDPTTQKAESPNPYSLSIVERKAERKDTVGKFPVASIFIGFAIGGPIMLVGLPLGALLVVHHSGCCMTNSIEQLISFWGSVLGGMLALFGMMITAVFVISAFRIDKSARAEAAAEAADAAGKFFHEYRREVIVLIDKYVEEVKRTKEQAVDYICAAKAAAEEAKKGAIKTIDAAVTGTESARDVAVGRIDDARTAAESASKKAVIEIVAEVAEVEHVAAEARARIGSQTDSPPSDSRD